MLSVIYFATIFMALCRKEYYKMKCLYFVYCLYIILWIAMFTGLLIIYYPNYGCVTVALFQSPLLNIMTHELTTLIFILLMYLFIFFLYYYSFYASKQYIEICDKYQRSFQFGILDKIN